MAVSTTLSSPRRKRFSLTLRVVIALLAFALLLFLAADVWFFRAAKASLPVVDGTLKVSGLQSPVVVTRDSLGVPNISAQNLHDLFFAQGFVTAQDRLWQMDMTRRYASGDLSAVLGPEYIKTDEEQRILGLRQVAEKTVANLPTEERARLQAYADGVNAYIAQHQKTLPLEFRLMTYFPYEWTVEDSMLVGLSMTEFLNHYEYKKELQREKVLAQAWPGADGGFVCEFLVARPRAGRGRAVNGERTAGGRESGAGRRGGAGQQSSKRDVRRCNNCRSLDSSLRSSPGITTNFGSLTTKPPLGMTALIMAFIPVPTTGSSPARTRSPASRCCRTTCIWICGCRTPGTRRI